MDHSLVIPGGHPDPVEHIGRLDGISIQKHKERFSNYISEIEELS